jgi:hypothetical protein
MKTEKELNEKIQQIMTKMRREYPQLSSYLKEMQDSIAEANNSGTKLKVHYDSLKIMLQYVQEYSSAPVFQ